MEPIHPKHYCWQFDQFWHSNQPHWQFGQTATLGGLVLIGAFYKESQNDNQLLETTQALKRLGKLILFCSACFLISYFMVEYVALLKSSLNFVQQFFVSTTAFFLAFGILSLSLAMGNLITIVRFI
jgi:hypothetical protein